MPARRRAQGAAQARPAGLRGCSGLVASTGVRCANRAAPRWCRAAARGATAADVAFRRSTTHRLGSGSFATAQRAGRRPADGNVVIDGR